MQPTNLHERLVSSTRVQTILALVIILSFAAVNILSVRREFSLTRDEDKHYLYGENILSGNSSRFDDSKMPVTALNALPAKIAQLSGDDRLTRLGSRFYLARSVTILFSCLIAFLVYYWSRALYGFLPAIFSLLLYVLDPTIMAHSQLVTTDIYAVGTVAFAFFWLWRFANGRNLWNGLWCLFALGISQVAKYTSVVLFPLFLAAMLLYDFSPWGRVKREKEATKKIVLRYGKYAVTAALASILVINVGFLFNRTFTPFDEYVFRSSLFQKIQSEVSFLNHIPVPVPYPYLEGLDLIRYNEKSGSSYGNIYLLGHTSPVKGFPGYFIIAFLLKVPIATQIILALALVVYFSQKGRRGDFFRNEIFLLVSVAFFTVYFNFFYNAQIGIRHFLPVFPLLYVFSGGLFTGWKGFSSLQKTFSWGLMVYLFVSVFSYYPYNLSYFNEIVWDRTQAYKYLADSNIDWGQGQNELWEYISANPSSVYQPSKVLSGRIIVSVNDLVGINIDPGQYAWLRNNFEPVDTIAYTYIVYDISQADLDAMCAATDYCEK
jgi:hypothetical protein